MRFIPTILLLLIACNSGRLSRAAVRDSLESATLAQAPVVTKPTVVAFWLAASDTLAGDRAGMLDDFRAYTARVAPRLREGDIDLVATTADSIIVELEGGPVRVIPLRGLDYPFGYVLVEPGFAETILTGLSTEDELLEQVDWYFGLEVEEKDTPRAQTVSHPAVRGHAQSERWARTACAGTRCWGGGRHAAGSHRLYSLKHTGS